MASSVMPIKPPFLSQADVSDVSVIVSSRVGRALRDGRQIAEAAHRDPGRVLQRAEVHDLGDLLPPQILVLPILLRDTY